MVSEKRPNSFAVLFLLSPNFQEINI
uniref:Uncharacterized protein n=1 Tax=Anguilla anguilla TaxID=7936 RepID=A0A0E9RPT2_ANGAN